MMRREKLKAEDLELIERVLLSLPEVDELVQLAVRLSRKVSYPINAFDDLVQVLGGDEELLLFRGQPISVAQVRKMIPAYYFPIANEADLLSKIADLRERASLQPDIGVGIIPTVRSEMAMGQIQWASPLKELPQGASVQPTISPEEISSLTNEVRGMGAGVGGHSRKEDLPKPTRRTQKGQG
jgi:hypothetical protein